LISIACGREGQEAVLVLRQRRVEEFLAKLEEKRHAALRGLLEPERVPAAQLG
jgi:hypothetical protein